jgi:hypothetical protein
MDCSIRWVCFILLLRAICGNSANNTTLSVGHNSSFPYCGNGICELTESCAVCPLDCAPCGHCVACRPRVTTCSMNSTTYCLSQCQFGYFYSMNCTAQECFCEAGYFGIILTLACGLNATAYASQLSALICTLIGGNQCGLETVNYLPPGSKSGLRYANSIRVTLAPTAVLAAEVTALGVISRDTSGLLASLQCFAVQSVLRFDSIIPDSLIQPLYVPDVRTAPFYTVWVIFASLNAAVGVYYAVVYTQTHRDHNSVPTGGAEGLEAPQEFPGTSRSESDDLPSDPASSGTDSYTSTDSESESDGDTSTNYSHSRLIRGSFAPPPTPAM